MKRKKRLSLATLHGGRVKKKTQPRNTSRILHTALPSSKRSKLHFKKKGLAKKLAVTHARMFRSRGEIKCRICDARLIDNSHFSFTNSCPRFGFTRALYHHVTRVHCRTARKLEFSEEERASALAALYPPEHTVKRLDPKKKYVCAVCKSVCDLLGLFVHMKQVHFGLLCQYCLKLFKKVRHKQIRSDLRFPSPPGAGS